jgi:uncharacterized protein YaiE (UPF0345 family)/ribosomal protein S18 acetylase RimI-like enzyme
MEIREVKDSELEKCAEVIRRGFRTVAEEFGLTEEKVPTNGAFIKLERLAVERAKGLLQFALLENGDIIGFVQLEKANEETYYLEKLSVVPEHRHAGYGRALMDYAGEMVSALGGKKIGITIIEENERLKSWYIKNGYTHTGTKKFEHLPFTVGFMELNIGKNTEDKMDRFEQVAVVKKANIYFDGKVTSRTVLFADGTKKTLGIMMPGDYEFGTADKELMEILGGTLKVLLPGSSDWATFKAGQSFEVRANSRFKLVVDEVTDYCCSYIKE